MNKKVARVSREVKARKCEHRYLVNSTKTSSNLKRKQNRDVLMEEKKSGGKSFSYVTLNGSIRN